jgi:hypothetical protein
MKGSFKKKDFKKQEGMKKLSKEAYTTICTNMECKLRKTGCKGFESCPGYKGK